MFTFTTPEYDKMLRGERYDTADAELSAAINRVKDLCHAYNNVMPSDAATKQALLTEIIGEVPPETVIHAPFYCDYGQHIRLGRRFFANFHLTILDEAWVTIGDDCFIGPNVSIYTACHPLDPASRNACIEWAEPVTIGDSCWIGGGATILPGVTIGEGCTIGAGSVVTHDVPPHTVAVGNPAKVIRQLA